MVAIHRSRDTATSMYFALQHFSVLTCGIKPARMRKQKEQKSTDHIFFLKIRRTAFGSAKG